MDHPAAPSSCSKATISLEDPLALESHYSLQSGAMGAVLQNRMSALPLQCHSGRFHTFAFKPHAICPEERLAQKGNAEHMMKNRHKKTVTASTYVSHLCIFSLVKAPSHQHSHAPLTRHIISPPRPPHPPLPPPFPLYPSSSSRSLHPDSSRSCPPQP